MHRRRLALSLLALTALAAPAEARFSRGGTSSAVSVGSCPYGAGLGDGCPGNGGLMRNSSFETSIQQSGQTYYASHPYNWNVPYIDYGVGHYTAANLLADPATLPLCQASNPACIANCVLAGSGIQGAYYCPSYAPAGGKPAIMVGANAAPFTLSGYNLSPNSKTGFGHDCTFIAIDKNTSFNLTLDNLYFENAADCSNSLAGGSQLYLIGQTNSPLNPVTYTLQNSTFLGHGQIEDCCGVPGLGYPTPSTSQVNDGNFGLVSIACNAACNFVYQYNYTEDVAGHIFGFNSIGAAITVTMLYDVFNGFHTRTPQGHGEIGNITNAASIREGYMIVANPKSTTATLTAQNSIAQNVSTYGPFLYDHNIHYSNRVYNAPTQNGTYNGSVDGAGNLTISAITAGTGPYEGGAVGNVALTTLVSGSGIGSVWKYDCGENTPSGVNTVICPDSTSSTGHFNATTGSGSFTGMGLTYTLGNANLDLAHGAYTGNVPGYTGSVVLQSNYFDPTGITNGKRLSSGSGSCANPTQFIGNVDLVSGAAITAWDTTGGTGC